MGLAFSSCLERDKSRARVVTWAPEERVAWPPAREASPPGLPWDALDSELDALPRQTIESLPHY